MLRYCKSIIQKTFVLIMANMALNLQAVDRYCVYNKKTGTEAWLTFKKKEVDGHDEVTVRAENYLSNGTLFGCLRRFSVNEDQTSVSMRLPQAVGLYDFVDVPFLTHGLLTGLLEGSQPQPDYVMLPFMFYSDGTVGGTALLRDISVTRDDVHAFTVTGVMNTEEYYFHSSDPAWLQVHVTIAVQFNPDNNQIASFQMQPTTGEHGNTDFDFTVRYAPELPAPQAALQMPAVLPTQQMYPASRCTLESSH